MWRWKARRNGARDLLEQEARNKQIAAEDLYRQGYAPTYVAEPTYARTARSEDVSAGRLGGPPFPSPPAPLSSLPSVRLLSSCLQPWLGTRLDGQPSLPLLAFCSRSHGSLAAAAAAAGQG